MGIKKDIFIKKTNYKIIDGSVESEIKFAKEYTRWLYDKIREFKAENDTDSLEDYDEEFIQYLKDIDD